MFILRSIKRVDFIINSLQTFFTEGPLLVEFSTLFMFVEYLSADLWIESYGTSAEDWCLVHYNNMP